MAREAFERAINLDSADPLARFGLGLAIIRDGALAEGRRYLEMAVGLDSTNSLLRSYLGKAYFEEKRDPLDARQFALAKQLDPLDPTPYLYDAIRLQSINRPVEAMLSMEKSIDLNDNRAVNCSIPTGLRAKPIWRRSLTISALSSWALTRAMTL